LILPAAISAFNNAQYLQNVSGVMEEHPMEKWDQLVCNTLYPMNLKNVLSGNGNKDLFIEDSKNARDQTRSYLISESLLRRNEQEIRFFVEQNQFFLTRLLNVIFEYRSENGHSFDMQQIYERVANDLESIILFVETSFSPYINQHVIVPRIVREKFEKSIRPELSTIKKKWFDHEKNQQLIESIFSIFDNLLQSSGPEQLSFHHLNYLRYLVIAISKWNFELDTSSKLPQLIVMLIALKFNEEDFLLRVFNLFKEKLTAIESDEEHLQLLKEYYKIVSQIVEGVISNWYIEKPSAKEIVLDWLSQEIYFFENRYPKKENHSSITTSAKINTSLSVPVLALYIRLFKETGIITNTNYQELFRAVSSTFTTHRKAEVAHSHLHSKFYAIEESARRKVFDQLMQMAHLCKRIG
jgi:hypothetical protein